MSKIPVTVIIATKNEEHNIARCLCALSDFDEVIVVDSNSDDKTVDISKKYGARVEQFSWNKKYPKKRQWCLEYLEIKNDFVFFVDADEVLTQGLVDEIKVLDFMAAGYFVLGQYIWFGRTLKYGLRNNKLALLNRHKMHFPVVNDLDIAGMGEIEGHYQPILKPNFKTASIAQLSNMLLHYAIENKEQWVARHLRYAKWEVQMDKRHAWPNENNTKRLVLKFIFKNIPLRPFVAFCHSYFLKCGFLDGHAGYEFAKSRAEYYTMINREKRDLGT